MTYLENQLPVLMEAREAPQTHNGVPLAARGLDVSIVMPCLNEEEAVEGCVTEARKAIADLGLSGEILVVDNGSLDDSAKVARAAGARVIEEPERGYGNACRRGLAEARGRFLVMGDADGTYDFSALPDFIEPLLDGADMVVGNRLNSQMERGAMPWLHRHVGNPALTKTMNVLFGSDIGDAHCGLRSIKKSTYDRLSLISPGMEFASEFIIEAVHRGARIKQVPIVYRLRHGGQPKLRSFRDGFRHLRLMFARSKRMYRGGAHQPIGPDLQAAAVMATGGGNVGERTLIAGRDPAGHDVNVVSAKAPAGTDRLDLA